MQAQTPTVVAREAPRGGVTLVFCERGYTSLSIWGYCFLQLPAKDALVPALIWVLRAGQYPLHHSICLPKYCSKNVVKLRLLTIFFASLGITPPLSMSWKDDPILHMTITVPWRPKTQRHSEDKKARSKPDPTARTAHTTVHHYNGTQYCSTETLLLIFPFLKNNITPRMWPNEGKGEQSNDIHSKQYIICQSAATWSW